MTYEDALAEIKRKGFTHIKFEIEASLARREHGYDEDDVAVWLNNNVSDAARLKPTYAEFYDDGSVDSELTITYAVEDAHLVLEYIEAFKQFAYENDRGATEMSQGAGFHITLLTSGTYPTRAPMNAVKLKNFTEQVSKLLPALYLMSTHNGRTRTLGYRNARISDRDKYSAIYTHRGTCLEYRIFDPCFDRPEAVFDKVITIARTIKFFSKVKTAIKPIQAFLTESDHIEGMIGGTACLTLLNQGLKYLAEKPGEAKKQRNFTLTHAKLAQKERIEYKELEIKYERHFERFERINVERINLYIEKSLANNGNGYQVKPAKLAEGIEPGEPGFEAVKSHMIEIGRLYELAPKAEWINNNKSQSGYRVELTTN